MPIDQFRGISLNQLALMLEVAAARGGITLMKHTNVRENVGKAPHLVLAEQMIVVLNAPTEEIVP